VLNRLQLPIKIIMQRSGETEFRDLALLLRHMCSDNHADRIQSFQNVSSILGSDAPPFDFRPIGPIMRNIEADKSRKAVRIEMSGQIVGHDDTAGAVSDYRHALAGVDLRSDLAGKHLIG